MLHIATRMLRFRKRTFVAALVALVCGAIIVIACGGIMETGIRHAVPAQRLAAAPIVVTGDQSYDGAPLPERARIDTGLVAAIERVPGVADAVPDTSFPVTVARHGLLADGHSWTSAQLAPYELTRGHAPVGPDQVVLEQHVAARAGARTGDHVELAVRGGTESFTIAGIASAPKHAPGALFFSDATATRLLAAPGRVDAIGVLLRPGTDVAAVRARIHTALAGQPVRVLTGDQRGMAEFPAAQSDAASLISLAGVFGGLAVMSAVFVVGSTLALLVQLRMREMALLTAIGATSRQLRRMVIAETLLVGVLATALAYLPGRSLGRWLLHEFANSGAVSTGIAFRQGWIPAVAGSGVALLTALVAAVVASRRATRVRPVEALTESDVPRRWLSAWRLGFAGLFIAGGVTVSVVTGTVMSGPVAESTAIPAAMLWSGGLALLAPGLTRALVAVLRWPVRAVTGLAGELGARNARAHQVRLASAVTSVMLAAGLASALVYMQTGQASAARHAYTDDLRADAVVTSAGGGMSPALVDTIAAAPGVADASALVTSAGYFELTASQERRREDNDEPDDLPLRGVSGGGLIAAPAVAGSFAALSGDAIALPTKLARESGRHVGDTVRMRLGDGAHVQLRVIASFAAPAGYPSAFVPASLLLAHSTTGLVPQILLRTKPGTRVSELATTLRRLAGTGPPMQVAGRGALATAAVDHAHQWVDYLLAAAIVGYAVIALINTLIIATTERRREFALQRLIGSTDGQLVRMMAVESVLVVGAGLVLGAVVATAALVPFGIALTGSALPAGPVWIALAVIGGAAALTVSAVLLPTALALRKAPLRTAVA